MRLLSAMGICLASPASATGTPPDECFRAARFAAHETKVPLKVLLAITQVETGRKIHDKVQPWPWAINHGGKGKWLASEAELLEAALGLIADGERLFDVGCFQLNYHWHGREFSSLDEMIAPRANALYAARFLEALFVEFGDWTEAVGAYHSRTEALANAYKAKFLQYYDDATEPLQLASRQDVQPKRVRRNSYPLLVARPATARLGSLVPETSQ
ncbi:MAG: lytic transglycosylase domain-containing protein [Planktotalea sp.]|uniref:lytic transglycosylase domain-containing protein n=1 Tax=Planktotalea sp. TaxID=2029877 RepID=UPI003C7675D8